AEQLCEYVGIIAGGQKVLDGRLRDVRRANRGNRYLIEGDEASAEADRFIQGNRRLRRKTQRGAELGEVERAGGDEPGELLAELARLPVPLHRFERIEPSLHEIFVAHVGNAAVAERRPEPAHV